VSRCRSCQAPVQWAITENGKRMPLDADPVPGGGVTELGTDADGALLVRATPNAGTRSSHFASCPNAKEHRR
jgi:hypothetical protein